jgi:SAM-dependent methyltransferase
MIAELPRPLTILDVGGLPGAWERVDLVNQPGVQITLLNTAEFQHECHTGYPNVDHLVGDARDMRMFLDRQFDVIYSNSVIEHVGGAEDRVRMASEIRRVGKRYFVQTPYRYFPIEPHFVCPLFQFLPTTMQVYLVRNYDLGWHKRIPDRESAERAVRSIELLSKREFRTLFPDATVTFERFGGLVKSLLAYRM